MKIVLTLQERIFIVENVLRKGGKYTKEVQELFQEKFGAERLPHRNCVSALLHKFKETGSVQDKPKTGRPKVVTDTVLQNVTNKLKQKITSVIQNIQTDELERVFQNTQRRARLCLQVNGAHFQQLL